METDPKDPFAWFEAWRAEMEASGEPEPAAVTLATAGADGAPSARVVLLRGVEEGSFRFFTNYESRKGLELASNPRATLLFYWPKTFRQVRVEGEVERLSVAESDAYWASRPRESQLSGATSPQSRPIPSREWLEGEVEKTAKRIGSGSVPRPSGWGGYRVIPTAFEFWQGRQHRLHERTRFTRDGNSWRIELLAP